MKDNALRIILFMYLVSGCLVVGDTLMLAPMGMSYVDMNGNPAGPQISVIWDMMQQHDQAMMLEELHQLDGDIIQNAIRSIELGLQMTVEMLKLMTGTYAFDILTIFGIPWQVTAIVQGAYTILLARAILGYLPAISGAIRALTGLGRAGVGVVDAARSARVGAPF